MEVFGPPLKYLAPYTFILAQAQFPTLTPPLTLNLTLNQVVRGPNTWKYLDLGEQIGGIQIFCDSSIEALNFLIITS